MSLQSLLKCSATAAAPRAHAPLAPMAARNALRDSCDSMPMDSAAAEQPSAMDTLHCVRQLLVQHMDSEAKAAWRVACREAAADVYTATTALAFRGKGVAEHELPAALLAKCPGLKQLSCTGMQTLATLQGLPANITTLDLSRCECLDTLAPLHKLTSLSTLSMEGEYKCTAEQPQQLSAALERLPSLEHLQLQRCADRWPDAAAAAMYPALASLTNLRTLHIIGHHLASDAMSGIAAALQGLVNLTHLNLRSTYFASEGAVVLAPALSALAAHGRLAKLELRCNFVRVRGADALAPALAQLAPWLTHLDLSENALSPVGVAMLLPAVAAMRRLEELHLAHNGCGEQGAVALAGILSPSTAGNGEGEGEREDAAAGAAGAAGGAGAGALPCLRLLDLRGNGLEGCAAAVTQKLLSGRAGRLQVLL